MRLVELVLDLRDVDDPRVPVLEASGSAPSSRSVLAVLTRTRIVDVARQLDMQVASSGTEDAIVEPLATSRALRFRDLLQRLGCDELRSAEKRRRI